MCKSSVSIWGYVVVVFSSDDGDLGGVTTDADGAVKDQVIDKTRVTLFGPNSILGRSAIVSNTLNS